MRSIHRLAATLAVIGGALLPPLATPGGAATPPAESPSIQGKESPLACDRAALTAAERKKHFEEDGPRLRALKTGVRELPDGYEFEFPPDRSTYSLLAEWVSDERVCCPFFDIDVRSAREGGPLLLRLTGREGVKQFIEADGAAWLKR